MSFFWVFCPDLIAFNSIWLSLTVFGVFLRGSDVGLGRFSLILFIFFWDFWEGWEFWEDWEGWEDWDN